MVTPAANFQGAPKNQTAARVAGIFEYS